VVAAVFDEVSSSTVTAEPPLLPTLTGEVGDVPKTNFVAGAMTVKLSAVAEAPA
jgi:hypothetical protein